ncbi:autotransporter outer membrane beta-barrel domain-containing protein [Arsenicitalea aurantiaca]|uniref:autotransporter outer membrane beta-barrel domain-containing protein n=1 Tax=Arsenicitalea aurantiaca TaxID=1783274 RepID=UPI0013153A00|nr:autotransporter domain-containing protein [Arsenicitalea aurantiaca]
MGLPIHLASPNWQNAPDSYAETGGDAALSGSGGTLHSTFATLGLRVSTGFALGEAMWADLSGMIGWRHAFGDIVPEITHALSGGDAFTAAGTPIAQDVFLLETGQSVDVSATTDLNLSYAGQFGDSSQSHTVKARLAVRF